MPDYFDDLEKFRVQNRENCERAAPSTEQPPSRYLKTKKIDGDFLKGPIQLDWIKAATELPGKSPLAVGLAIWFEAGRRKRKNAIKLTTAILARFGIGRKAKYRGLEQLEKASLISVERKPRHNPKVTIQEVRGKNDDEKEAGELVADLAPSCISN